MGMRTRKHAIVVVLPRAEQQHDQRLMAAMQRAVREYVAMAQWMQPDEGNANAREATRSRCEGTRLVLSLNVLFPVGKSDDVEMARAVAVSGQANHVPQQIAGRLDAEITTWRRMLAGRNGHLSDTMEEDASSRCGAFLRLLDDLAAQAFVVSVISPADALPFGDGGACSTAELIATLQGQVKLDFIMLRDEDEESGMASKNVLQLLRGIKSSANRHCSIRQLEECEIEMQGVVKEWLHAAAPMISATLLLGENGDQDKSLELEIRANFVLVRAAEAPASSWMALHSALSNVWFHHFVPLKSVHPAMLLGCPLQAQPTSNHLARGHAFSRHLRGNGYGGLVSCTETNGVQNFYLMVNSPGGEDSRELLMYRVASAEEILLPEPGATKNSVQHEVNDSDKIAEELSSLEKLPIQDFNVFRNRSGILDVTLAAMSEPTSRDVGNRPFSAKTSSGSARTALISTHEAPSRGPAAPKKKRRL